jgi:hypothetical protein
VAESTDVDDGQAPRTEPRAWCFTARLCDGSLVAAIVALGLLPCAGVGPLIAGAVAALAGIAALVNIQGFRVPPPETIPESDAVGRGAAARIRKSRWKAWAGMALGLVAAGVWCLLERVLEH